MRARRTLAIYRRRIVERNAARSPQPGLYLLAAFAAAATLLLMAGVAGLGFGSHHPVLGIIGAVGVVPSMLNTVMFSRRARTDRRRAVVSGVSD